MGAPQKEKEGDSTHERLRRKLRRWAAQKKVYDSLNLEAQESLDSFAKIQARAQISDSGLYEDDFMGGEYESRVAAQRDLIWSEEIDRRYGVSVEETLEASRKGSQNGLETPRDPRAWVEWARLLPEQKTSLGAAQLAQNFAQKAVANATTLERLVQETEKAQAVRAQETNSAARPNLEKRPNPEDPEGIGWDL